ncbi:MAG: (E)-4-hydroxy-3-methylbut-2-enyl-diphosphate synthase [Candidatus Peregrinibacteria bacterium]
MITIQSMTNTDTANAAKTANQAVQLIKAGAELIRITVNSDKAAKAVPKIRQILNSKGYKHIPLIGDFHFTGSKLLQNNPQTAKALHKYRINPSNEPNFDEFIKLAIKHKKLIRIGLNAGSTFNPTPQNLVKLAIKSAKRAEALKYPKSNIYLSVKTSNVKDTIKAYELLAKYPYKIHLGLTEAGSGDQAIIHTTAALAPLLNKGIGDTIRVSLTPKPGQSRTKEVEVAKQVLQALEIRHFTTKVTSCPGCGRTNSNLFQKITKEINDHIKKHPTTHKNIAIMGCIVNGPGEASRADLALVLPGKTEKPLAHIYKKGRLHKTISGKNIAKQFIKEINVCPGKHF